MADKVLSRLRLHLTDPLVPTFLTGVDSDAILLHLVGSVDPLGHIAQDLAPLYVDNVGCELDKIPLVPPASYHHLWVTITLNMFARETVVPTLAPALVG